MVEQLTEELFDFDPSQRTQIERVLTDPRFGRCEVKELIDDLANGTEHLLSIREVSEYFRLSQPTIHRIIHAGTMPAIRFGDQFRIPYWRFLRSSGFTLDGSSVGEMLGIFPSTRTR